MQVKVGLERISGFKYMNINHNPYNTMNNKILEVFLHTARDVIIYINCYACVILKQFEQLCYAGTSLKSK
jgi:hypothetical protein